MNEFVVNDPGDLHPGQVQSVSQFQKLRLGFNVEGDVVKLDFPGNWFTSGLVEAVYVGPLEEGDTIVRSGLEEIVTERISTFDITDGGH